MKWVKENEEVFYPKQTEIIEVAKHDIDYLIQAGQNNTRNRARYCTHSSAEDDVHEMIIYIKKDTYIRPHKHLGKSESFHLVQGEADVVIFDENGNIKNVLRLGTYGSGRPFYYRLEESVYHTQIFTRNSLFHEVTKGPFERKDTIFPRWAPDASDCGRVEEYLNNLIFETKLFL